MISPVPGGGHSATNRTSPTSLALDVLAAVILPAVVVAGIYLAPFINDRDALPFGADTFGYMWRTDLVHDEGIEQLTREGTGFRKSLGERPAHLVVLSVLRSVTGATSLEIVWVLPAVLAAAVALAASALASDVAGESRGTAGLVGLGVGGSAFIAWTAVGYSTNLAFDSIAIGAIALAVRAAFGARRREAVGASVLLGGGSLFHWLFAPLVVALLAGWALLLAIGRLVLRSAARPAARAPVRVVAVIVGAALVAVAGFALAPEIPERTPGASLAHIEEFSRLRLPAMALGITIPLAAVGAILTVAGRGLPPRRRWAAAILLAWAGFAVVGLVGRHVVERAVFPYRWAGFALGIPILIVLGALAVAHLVRHPLTKVVGAVLGAGAAIWLAWAGAGVWAGREPRFGPELYAQLETVTRYADLLPEDTAIVVAADSIRRSVVRSGLRPDLYDRLEFAPLDRVESLPDLGRTDEFVIVYVESLIARAPPRPEGYELAPGVVVLRGPALEVVPGTPRRVPAPLATVGLTAACLGVLVLVGLGWALALTDLPVLGGLGLAPCFGLAMIGLVGLVADRVGVPLRGAGGISAMLAAAALGWALAVPMRFRPRGRPETVDAHGEPESGS